jgi:hypothetical protein
MSTAHTANGQPQRKQLSDQIDRLDAVLDGLSEGLNEAVAEAVRAGTRLALKDVMIEIMTDPVLRAKLHQATNPVASPAKTGFWARLKARVATTGQLLRGATAATVNAVTSAATTAKAAVRAAIRRPAYWLSLIARAKHVFAIGAGAGLAVATVTLAAPHELAAALSGISGAIAAMALRVALWTRRAVVPFPLT